MKSIARNPDITVAILVILVVLSLHYGTATGAKPKPATTAREFSPRDASLVLRGMVGGLGLRERLAVKGTTAYVGSWEEDAFGMLIVDASNPASPSVSGNFLSAYLETRYSVVPFSAVNDLLVIGSRSVESYYTPYPARQFHLLDVSAPLNPVIRHTRTLPAGRSPQNALLAPDARRLILEVFEAPDVLLDVTNPAAPVEVATNLPEATHLLWTTKELLAYQPRGMVGLDLSDPQDVGVNFKLLYGPAPYPPAFASLNAYYFPLGESNVLSVSALTSRLGSPPEEAGSIHEINKGEDYWSDDARITGRGTLVVAAWRGVIYVLSFRDPDNPVLLESHSIGDDIWDIKLAGDRLYVLAGRWQQESSLLIFQVETL